MSYARYGQRRRQQQFWWTVAKWTIAFTVIIAAGWYAYHVGDIAARSDVLKLSTDLKEVSERLTKAENENAKIRGLLAASRRKIGDWEQRYNSDVPKGEMKAFLDLINSRLQSGLPADRLRFVLDNVSVDRECDGDPETRRFIAATPLHRGGNDTARFAEKRVTVTAKGESSLNASGNAEAWFDPGQEVTVTFTDISGKTSTAKGLLPINHAMIVGNVAHMFTLAAGQRAFIEATHVTCAYP